MFPTLIISFRIPLYNNYTTVVLCYRNARGQQFVPKGTDSTVMTQNLLIIDGHDRVL